MAKVIKAFDAWGNHVHTFCGPEEIILPEAKEYVQDNGRIEWWSVHQYCPDQKLKEINTDNS